MRFTSIVKEILRPPSLEFLDKMLERLKSFRKKKKTVFPFSKLPDSLKIKILQHLEPFDISNFASCSKDSEFFVKENRDKFAFYEFEVMDLCYDPVTDAACLRAMSESRYAQSVVIDAKTIDKYLHCLRIRSSVSLVIGTFTLSSLQDQVFSIFNHLTFHELGSMGLDVSCLKRATEFMFGLDDLLTTVVSRSWTACEKFKVDYLVLFFHEQLYKQKAKKRKD
ncbi:hypothetical protein FO519_006562 [Halicephalobus sp. NKZ332]|nr:hypothetical protein FO519_006562 [Halicephalobus sp. NKZ332]